MVDSWVMRKLNREVDAFLFDNPANLEQTLIDNTSKTLLSPWPLREENKLRVVWKEEYPSNQAKTKALVEAVIASGIEPYEQPERFPKIERDEIRLICWMLIRSA